MQPSRVGIAGALSTEQDAAPEPAKTASPYYARDELITMRDKGGHYNAGKLIETALKAFELMNRARDERKTRDTLIGVMVADSYEDELKALRRKIKELEKRK